MNCACIDKINLKIYIVKDKKTQNYKTGRRDEDDSIYIAFTYNSAITLLIMAVFKCVTGSQKMGVRQPVSLKMFSADDSSTFMKAPKQLMVVHVMCVCYNKTHITLQSHVIALTDNESQVENCGTPHTVRFC